MAKWNPENARFPKLKSYFAKSGSVGYYYYWAIQEYYDSVTI